MSNESQSNREWLAQEEQKWEISKSDLKKAESVNSNTDNQEKLAEELGTNYTLDCWVEEEKCRAIWVEWITKQSEKIGVNISSIKDLVSKVHKWEDITLKENQKDIAKELIAVIAKEKGETLESAIAKSSWTDHDSEDDKLNHALNVAILNLNTKNI